MSDHLAQEADRLKNDEIFNKASLPSVPMRSTRSPWQMPTTKQ
jgi:hypothetical protein